MPPSSETNPNHHLRLLIAPLEAISGLQAHNREVANLIARILDRIKQGNANSLETLLVSNQVIFLFDKLISNNKVSINENLKEAIFKIADLFLGYPNPFLKKRDFRAIKNRLSNTPDQNPPEAKTKNDTVATTIIHLPTKSNYVILGTLEGDDLTQQLREELSGHETMILVAQKSLRQPQAVATIEKFSENHEQIIPTEEIQKEQSTTLTEIKQGFEAKTDTNPEVGIAYYYEDADINAIFKARFEEECAKFNSYLARMRPDMHLINATGNGQLNGKPEWCTIVTAKLKEDTCKGKDGILLIPYNQGGSHWIGLVLGFNQNGKITTIQYINSMTITVEKEEIYKQLNSSKLLTQGFTKENCANLPLLKQPTGDRSTCGAYVIENLVLAAQNLQNPKPISSQEIRALHLKCLEKHNPAFYYNSTKPTGEEVLGFYERQRQNKPSISNVKISTPRPIPSEQQSIDDIVNIIKSIPKACTIELKQLYEAFVFKKDDTIDAYHTNLKTTLLELSKQDIIAIEMISLKTQLFNDDDDSLNVSNTVPEKIGAEWEKLGLPISTPKPTGLFKCI